MPPQRPPKPEVRAARPERKPSVWAPEPIPTPGVGRSTEDPRTPTLKELAQRAARRAALTEVADGATRTPLKVTKDAREPGTPVRSGTVPTHVTRVARLPGARPTQLGEVAGPARRRREPHAFAWDPLGRDRLTEGERRRLGDLCRLGDCSRVQVYRGNGTQYANNLRADVLRVSGGRSVTLGNRIFLGDADRNNFAVLAHEVHHTAQYQRWGAVRYYNRGIGERVSELLGVNPYEYRIDGRRFDEYGMEQQGQIIEDLVTGKRGVRSIPGIPKVGP